MKKIILSSIAVLSIGSTLVSADNIKLYVDGNGQVFTKDAADRTLLEISGNTDKKKSITIVDQKSPEFLFGKQSHINMKFVADDNPDMWLKAGVRIQSTFENRKIDYKDITKADESYSDAYLRRVRFEVAAGFGKHASFVMDIRNDKANYEDKGEQEFNVGDAYVKIKKPFDTSLVNFKLYRAKIDVSRTETVKSARVLHYDRPQVADEAAQFITHNRRGTNAQVYGDWDKKIHYQIAFGDGIHSAKLKDSTGGSFSGDLEQKSYFYGAKLVLSPISGWEETSRTETYFAKGKHFEIGVAYWKSPDIKYDDGVVAQEIDHTLINAEISAHYKGAFVQAEYFDFDGVVQDWTNSKVGKSDGWYATGEYVFEEFGYLAPFVRYEKWDKFKDTKDYELTSAMGGINWYLQGNTIKAGVVYQEDKYEANIGDKTDRRVKLTSQWFF